MDAEAAEHENQKGDEQRFSTEEERELVQVHCSGFLLYLLVIKFLDYVTSVLRFKMQTKADKRFGNKISQFIVMLFLTVNNM